MIHFAKSGFINSHREVEDNCDCEELLIENRLLRELLLGGKKIVPEPLSESVPELESSILQDGRNIDTGSEWEVKILADKIFLIETVVNGGLGKK